MKKSTSSTTSHTTSSATCSRYRSPTALNRLPGFHPSFFPDASTPEGKEILDLQRATKFVPTKAENYEGIKGAARNAGLL